MNDEALENARLLVLDEMEEKTGKLDFSGLGLTKLPTELFGEGWTAEANLEHLREIEFNGSDWSDRQRETLLPRRPAIFEFNRLSADSFPDSEDGWKRLKNLKKISLRGSRIPMVSLPDEEEATTFPLPFLPKCLESLSLHGIRNLEDLSPLTRVVQLKDLDLAECHALTDLEPLGALTNLTTLNLTGCLRLSDLGPLAELPDLKELRFDSCIELQDLAPLGKMKSLEKLSLNWSGGSFEDLTPLVEAASLKSLQLAGGGVRDLTPLRKLKALEALDLRSCKSLRSPGPSDGFSQLRHLNLSHCDLRDLHPLSRMDKLETLNLDGCWMLNDLDVLAELPSLRFLSVRHCEGLKNLSVEGGFPALKRLEAGGCENLADVNLSELPELTALGLEECDQLENLHLTSLPKLGEWNLEGSGNLERLRLVNLPKLSGLDLESLPKLRDLDLAELPKVRKLDFESDLRCNVRLENLAALKELSLAFEHGKVHLSGLLSLEQSSLYYIGDESIVELENCPSLRALELSPRWFGYPGEDFGLTIKEVTAMSRLTIQFLWDRVDLSLLSSLDSLKELDLSHFMGATLELPELHALKSLDLRCSENLTDLSFLENVPGLRNLTLMSCKLLMRKDLVPIIGLADLEMLDLRDCWVSALPPELVMKSSLKELRWSSSENELESLRASIQEESADEAMNEARSRIVEEKQAQTGTLDLSGLTFRELPKAIVELPGVKKLSLRDCTELIEVRFDCFWTELEVLDLNGCEKLNALDLEILVSLLDLKLDGCGELSRVRLDTLVNLDKLDFSHCGQLEEVSLSELNSLETLNLSGNSHLPELDLRWLDSLETLDLGDCTHLIWLELWDLPSLRSLNLKGCQFLSQVHVGRRIPEAIVKQIESHIEASNLSTAKVTVMESGEDDSDEPKTKRQTI